MNKCLVLSYSLSLSVIMWLTLEHAGAVSAETLNPHPMGIKGGARLNVCAESQADFQFPNTALTSKICEMFSRRLSLDAGNTQPRYQCLLSASCVGMLCQRQLSGARIEGTTWAWVPESCLCRKCVSIINWCHSQVCPNSKHGPPAFWEQMCWSSSNWI